MTTEYVIGIPFDIKYFFEEGSIYCNNFTKEAKLKSHVSVDENKVYDYIRETEYPCCYDLEIVEIIRKATIGNLEVKPWGNYGEWGIAYSSDDIFTEEDFSYNQILKAKEVFDNIGLPGEDVIVKVNVY